MRLSAPHLFTFLLAAACLLFAVRPGAAANSSEDIKSLVRAAKSGDFSAQYKLGKAFLAGDGTSKDPAKALKWLKKSADQGYPKAMALTGRLYLKGKGVRKNPSRGVRYVKKAARYGVVGAQADLSRAFLKGSGTAKNPAKAYFWALVGRRGRNLDAKTRARLDKQAALAVKRLSPAGKKEAERKAGKWRPKSWKKDMGVGLVSGTGFLVSRSGYVITNRHVVDGCRTLHTKYKNHVVPLTVKKMSREHDLALLSMGRGVDRALTIRDNPIREGDEVLIMGYPLGRAWKNDPLYVKGRVGRAPALGNGKKDIVFFARGVTFGNSGSAVLDANGGVVGVVWGGNTLKDGVSRIWAVNLETLRAFLESNYTPYAARPTYGKRNMGNLGRDIREMVLPILCTGAHDR